MNKSVNYTLAILAVIKSGAAFVPLDPAHPVQRLKQLMQDTKPFILITTSSLAHLARQIFTKVLVIDANANQYEEIKTHHVTIHTASPEHAAYIMFTSGSTGKPKGVIIEHAAFTTSAMARGKITGLGPHSRVLQFAAHTFDVAVDEILTTLIHGGCVCVPSEAERFDISSTITRMQVNHALMTPTSAALLDPDLVPSLKTIQMGGELLSEHINNKWSSRVRLFNVYGPTEASVASVMNDRTGQRGAGHVIGLPVGTVCFVVDVDDHDILVPSNMVGELVIGGHTLARGYLDDTAKTNLAFIHSPAWASWSKAEYPLRFYKTGDLASMDSNGFLTIHGRKDNQIKLRGQRINVEEIEVALQTHEHIYGVIVDLPKAGPLKNKLTAVVPEGSKNKQHTETDDTRCWSSSAEMLDEDLVSDLHISLRNTVPLTMIPSVWISLPYMPQNSSAKTDRKQIRAWLEGLDAATYQSLVLKREVDLSVKDLELKKVPVFGQKDAELEAQLKAIWCEVLNTSIDGIQEKHSFVRNGGDSITAMELRSLASAIGVSVKISDILTAESVEALLQSSSRAAVQTNAYWKKRRESHFRFSQRKSFT
jgi:amino acid adenylation domain-containing protein